MFQNQPLSDASPASVSTAVSIGSSSTADRRSVWWRGPMASTLMPCRAGKARQAVGKRRVKQAGQA
jgi:hypothetical protein